jgi:hypothetical protein
MDRDIGVKFRDGKKLGKRRREKKGKVKGEAK